MAWNPYDVNYISLAQIRWDVFWHAAPRRKGDGLKGFFWPRGKYKTPEEVTAVLSALRSAIAQVQQHP